MGVAAAQGVNLSCVVPARELIEVPQNSLARMSLPCPPRRDHQVADIVLVDVATQHHGVAQGLLRQGVQQACTCGRVAVPAVGGQLAPR